MCKFSQKNVASIFILKAIVINYEQYTSFCWDNYGTKEKMYLDPFNIYVVLEEIEKE